jgi:predicted AlkP superfamily phosphohydrolase/phosphomutase
LALLAQAAGQSQLFRQSIGMGLIQPLEGRWMRRVFVVGLDGGTLDLLGPWMQEGRLPHLQQLIEAGVSGELESTVPPQTAVAWSSFMTGKNPGKHGLFDFITQEKLGYGIQVVDSRARRGKSLWELIGEAGGRVVVLNVPTTYPPPPVNGVLGGDFLTPTGKKDVFYPPEILAEIEGRLGKYPLHVIPPYFTITRDDADVEKFVAEYQAAIEYTFHVTHDLIDRIDPVFLMVHIYGNDQLCHWLWHILDKTHPLSQPEAHRKHFERILAYYQRLDAEIGRLLSRVDDDTTLIVMSDHGFGPIYKVIHLNTWLIQEGYLRFKNTSLTRIKSSLWRSGFTLERVLSSPLVKVGLRMLVKTFLAKRAAAGVDQLKRLALLQQLLLSYDDVDWAQTRAFCLLGLGQIKINVRGRYPQGCVAPGPEYEALKEEIIDKLRMLRDPETGKLVGGKVFARDEVYRGESFEDAPDITFMPMDAGYVANSRITGFISNKVFSTYTLGITGFHRMSGMLIAKGPSLLQRAQVDGARIIDLLPTILYQMGLKIPSDVDGQVLERIFREEFLQSHAIEFSDHSMNDDMGVGQKSAEEDEEVIARLRALGYL